MNHWKKHELRHFLLSSKSCIFPPVIYSVPRAPSQARVYNLPPVAQGFIALGLIKSPLTAMEVCSAPQTTARARGLLQRARAITPGRRSARGNASAITHLSLRPPGRRAAASARARCTSAVPPHFRPAGAALLPGLLPPRPSLYSPAGSTWVRRRESQAKMY